MLARCAGFTLASPQGRSEWTKSESTCAVKDIRMAEKNGDVLEASFESTLGSIIPSLLLVPQCGPSPSNLGRLPASAHDTMMKPSTLHSNICELEYLRNGDSVEGTAPSSAKPSWHSAGVTGSVGVRIAGNSFHPCTFALLLNSLQSALRIGLGTGISVVLMTNFKVMFPLRAAGNSRTSILQ